MATDDRRESIAVRDGLNHQSSQFNFYQAVRLLIDDEQADLADLVRLDRAIEFSTESGDQFPGKDVFDIDLDAKRSKIKVSTFGLTGPLGPMPQQHSEWIDAENRAGRSALKAFLQLFEHRFVALLYLVKQRFRLGLHNGSRHSSNLYRYLTNISGLQATQSKPNKATNEQEYSALLPFAGMLAGGRTSAVSVSHILSSLLNAPVKLESMQGAFVRLDAHHQARLGAAKKGAQVQQKLGDPIALGTRVWNQQYALGIEIGPVVYATADTWIPGEPDYEQLVKLLRFTTNGQWVLYADIDVVEQTIPQAHFQNGLKLGYNSWLKSRAADPNAASTKRSRRVIYPTHIH